MIYPELGTGSALIDTFTFQSAGFVRNSSVSIVSSLHTGISRNGGSNAGGDKRFCSPNHLYRSRFPSDILLNGYLRFKRAGRETDHSYHKVLGLRISGALPPASDTLSW